MDELAYSYSLGSRFVDFEGGEPTLWSAGGKTLNDLCTAARQLGFFSTTVTTNAQRPFGHLNADSVWVSLDGVGPVHDDIRGPGAFAALEANVASSGHRALSANLVINTRNLNSFEQTVAWVKANPALRSLSVNFHTPFSGTEDLEVRPEDRQRIVARLVDLKRQGAPLMNSVAGLKRLAGNDYKKVCWVTNFVLNDGTRLAECQGRSAGLCDRCGFGMAAEMRGLFDFSASTIWAGLKLRILGRAT